MALVGEMTSTASGVRSGTSSTSSPTSLIPKSSPTVLCPAPPGSPAPALNYAEHALRAALDDDLADEPAIITVTEDGNRIEITWRELRRQVGSVAAWLRGQGVGQGDRVVGYLPNTHHTLIAFLASASLGAIWSACAQDYAAEGAAAKLGQLEPKVLFAADGYLWNGTAFDRRDQVADLATRIPSLRAVVGVGNLGVVRLDETDRVHEPRRLGRHRLW